MTNLKCWARLRNLIEEHVKYGDEYVALQTWINKACDKFKPCSGCLGGGRVMDLDNKVLACSYCQGSGVT